MASVVVTPSKPAYQVGETVVVTVSVEGAFEGMIATVPVVAAVMVDGEPLTGQVEIDVQAPPAEIEFVSVEANGQLFAQDPVDPARFTGLASLPAV